MTTTMLPPSRNRAWYAVNVEDAARLLRSDPAIGLSGAEAARRLKECGSNSIPRQPSPNIRAIAVAELGDPMNLMLLVVAFVSMLVGESITGLLVAVLWLLNVVVGTNEERKAKAGVQALARLQVPTAKVLRDGSVAQLDAMDVVPGDLVMLAAGDLVPADGRIASSARLEVIESVLTGQSFPVAKDASTLPNEEVPLGDRSNMLFQNTSVTRGAAALLVTATGTTTEMGRIAGLLTAVERAKSPLKQELDSVTTWLGMLSWLAVPVIVVVGWVRGLGLDTLVLIAVCTAIAAIPPGLPTFVQVMLSSGARRLADAKAVVMNLPDVETLGSTSAINSDMTGILTLNEMTATSVFTAGQWFTIEGTGYGKSGAVLRIAGEAAPDFTPLALGLTLCSDATVSDDGAVVGNPIEAALVVLAAKIGVDAQETRRQYPRVAEVPFDSADELRATFHLAPRRETDRLAEAVKGAPDVVLDRCAYALWHGRVVPVEQVRGEVQAADRALSERGLRVLSFALRWLPEAVQDAVRADPSSYVGDLTFVCLVGIIDPLRPSAKAAVATALQAGIDVRMITADHAMTARAIADGLGLAEGTITGAELERTSDEVLLQRIPYLHVFSRLAPQDKLRLVDLMQRDGLVVAMTGDAVNDAAALKRADIGVAMGSGSQVSRQAATVILTDDSFATLVHAVELGRGIHGKISACLRHQLQGSFGVLMLMIIATVFNINSGVALTPAMLLFVNVVVAVFPVIAISCDGTDPGIMTLPPRGRGARMVNRGTVLRWAVMGLLLALAATLPLVSGPDQPQVDGPSVSMTMAFAVSALAALGLGWVARRDPGRSGGRPTFPYLGWIGCGVLLVVLSVEVPLLQRWLDTTGLTALQWLGTLVLALVAPLAAVLEKETRRRRAVRTGATPPFDAAPS